MTPPDGNRCSIQMDHHQGSAEVRPEDNDATALTSTADGAPMMNAIPHEDSVDHTERESPQTTSYPRRMNHPLSLFLHALFDEGTTTTTTRVDTEGDSNSCPCLVDIMTIVTDNAASVPARYTKSQMALDEIHRDNSWGNSMPNLDRWNSQSVKRAAAAVAQPSLTIASSSAEPQLPQEPQTQQSKRPTNTTCLSSPAKLPQRRTSFQGDDRRVNSTQDSNNSYMASASQSLSQLQTLQEAASNDSSSCDTPSCRRAMPPRVPVRRTSGRVSSPPLNNYRRGSMEMLMQGRDNGRAHPTTMDGKEQQQQDEEEDHASFSDDDSETTFELDFSESFHDIPTIAEEESEDEVDHSRRARDEREEEPFNASATMSSCAPAMITCRQDKPRTTLVDTGLRKPQRLPESPKPTEVVIEMEDLEGLVTATSIDKTVEGISTGNDKANEKSDDGVEDGMSLPYLESIANPPHRRHILPRQPGFRRLDGVSEVQTGFRASRSNTSEIVEKDEQEGLTSSTMQAAPTQEPTKPPQVLTNTAPCSDDELNLDRVASSKMMPLRSDICAEPGPEDIMTGNNDKYGDKDPTKLYKLPPFKMDPESPTTTVHKAVKRSIMGRAKKRNAIQNQLHRIHANLSSSATKSLQNQPQGQDSSNHPDTSAHSTNTINTVSTVGSHSHH